jgi:SAM-dependent methyltransferase
VAEATVFIFIAGFLTIGLVVAFRIDWIDPRWIGGVLLALLAPGFYAAVTSGLFVPSSRQRHKNMLALAKLTKKDTVYDVGCGDGRLVFAAAKTAKKAIGYELSIPLYLFGRLRQVFSRRPARIRFGDIWKQDYRDADVIFVYLLPKAMKQFYKVVWPTLKPGTRVVSNAFQIHEMKPVAEKEKVFLYVR